MQLPRSSSSAYSPRKVWEAPRSPPSVLPSPEPRQAGAHAQERGWGEGPCPVSASRQGNPCYL